MANARTRPRPSTNDGGHEPAHRDTPAPEAAEGRAYGSDPPADSGADRRAPRPRLARFHQIPPVAFSPDWRTLLEALVARDEALPASGRVYAFDSARAGLRFALERLAEAAPLRRQVVVPAYTCYSVAAAVEHAGLELVVCDVDPRTLDLVPAELARLAGEQTLCIVAAQLFGCGVDLERASGVARRVGCHLVEDAAQASDPMDDAHAPGKLTLRLLSTGRGKPLSTGGGGLVSLYEPALRPRFDAVYARLPGRTGAVADARQALQVALMKLLVHPRLFWAPAAIPALRLGDTIYPEAIAPERPEGFRLRLQGRLQGRFERERRTRRAHAAAYRRFIGARAGLAQPRALSAPDYAPHRFPVYLARDRADAAAAMERARRAGIAPMYPAPLTDLPRVRGFCANPDAPVPGARWIARRLVTLPTHGRIDAAARARVLDSLEDLGV